jgi:hypothetical protein
VARRVDDVDSNVIPEARRGRRGDGNAALLLLLHPVHDGGAIMHLSHLVRSPCVVENALRRGRFTGIDMRHDADIAIFLELYCSRHKSFRANKREPDLNLKDQGPEPPQ